MALMDEKDIAAGQLERSAYRLNTVATKIGGQELVKLKGLAARRRQSTSDLIRELILAELERDSGPSRGGPDSQRNCRCATASSEPLEASGDGPGAVLDGWL